MGGRLLQLDELKLEVTYRCPLACVHCSSDGRPDNDLEMASGAVTVLLEEAAQLGVTAVAFSGGEPLEWAGIRDAVEQAASLGMETTVYTTGHALGFRETFTSLHRAGLNRVIYSLYAADATSHDRVTRIAGSQAATLAAIAFSSDLGVDTELHFVAFAENYRALPAVVSLGRESGVSRTSVLRFVPQGRGALLADAALSRVEAIELRRLIETARVGGADVRTGSPWNYIWINDRPVCPAAQDRLVVGPDYMAFPCDAFKQADVEQLTGTRQGCLAVGGDLADCWRDSPFLNTVRDAIAGAPRQPCAGCRMLSRCGSGCIAQRSIALGSIEKGQDPQCLLQ